VALVLMAASVSHGFVFGDFEDGFDGWIVNDWDSPPGTISNSEIGATLGNQSLRIDAPRPDWTISAGVKFQDVFDDYMTEIWPIYMASRAIAMDITIDPNDWVAAGDDAWVNILLVVNSELGSWLDQGGGESDTVNPGFPGGWDPNSFPTLQTRTVVWDINDTHAALAGGGGGWFEVFVIINSGGFPNGGAIYIDNVRFISNLKAYNPNPADMATDVPVTQRLSWEAGALAASHDVYFGMDAGAVTAAVGDSDATVRYANVGVEQFDPGTLEYNTTYFWRVDEVNEADPNSPWTGDVWSFTTGNFVLVEDFESYNDEGNLIYDTWVDGFVNGTGATVGHLNPPYAEQSIVHTGSQSMPLAYDNFAAPNYSEATRQLDAPQDWVQTGGEMLTVWIQGGIGNSPEPMFVGLADDTGALAYVLNADLELVSTQAWQRWDTALSAFSDAGVNLAAVSAVSIGVGDPVAPVTGFNGMVYVDDIWVELVAPDAEPSDGSSVTVVNPSFELPGTEKIKGWNGEGVDGTPAVDIPGWASDTEVMDSGVEMGWGATDGLWTAFLMGGDPSVWQLTEHVIAVDEVFQLAVDTKNNWQATTLQVTLYYDEDGARVSAATQDVTLTDSMTEVVLAFSAADVPEAIGKNIGIEFDNVTEESGSWLALDDVRLDLVDSAD
jgi:hypothetical protein